MTSIAKLMKSNFPSEMTAVPLWLNFKLVDKGNGKFSKPPISPYTGEICAKNDESMYSDFERALLGVEQHDTDGLGFVFLHGFIAIDLDNCFQADGSLTELASDIVDHFLPTYIEYSPSGNGLHIFCKGAKPNDRTRVAGIEVYSGYNFVTVTGDKVVDSGSKVLNMQDELDWLYEKYFPILDTKVKAEVIEVDHGGKSVQEWLDIGLTHDDKFHRLYSDTKHLDDESSHDMALMCKLAYWLNHDIDAMERVFIDSPWTQTKDMAHIRKIDSRSDYLCNTIDKAAAMIKTCAADNERKVRNIAASAVQLSEKPSGEIVLPISDYTDIANARAFSDVYSQELAFTKEFGWCSFCGMNWELNQQYYAQSMAVEFAENLLYLAKEYMDKLKEECVQEGFDPTSKMGKAIIAPAVDFMRHAQKTNSESGVRAMLKLSESMMNTPSSLFDGNPWVLNTPNVVVDLRTGESYPPAWNHYNSMMTNIPYMEDAENHGVWDSFLQDIFCGDNDLIEYAQYQWGAACVGRVYEENLMIATGCGSNGKSTCFSVLKGVLGDYCASINPDILMNKMNYEQQIAIVSLKGKRLVIGQETESGQQLSAASVKRVTSTDTLVGRVLNHGYIEFEPTHTLMMATNHLPTVKDNDEGTWRRLTVIPFEATFDTNTNAITNFQDILINEDGEYILKWLVEGAKKFYENGCKFPPKPAAVIRASLAYRNSQKGYFERFCDECLELVNPVKEKDVFSNPDDIYAVYLEWCTYNRTKPYSKIALSKRLQELGVDSKCLRFGSKTKRMWRNVRLKEGVGFA